MMTSPRSAKISIMAKTRLERGKAARSGSCSLVPIIAGGMYRRFWRTSQRQNNEIDGERLPPFEGDGCACQYNFFFRVPSHGDGVNLTPIFAFHRE